MANLRAIRARIKSVENTRQITKSMKMVAAAKLRRTQSAFSALKTYAEKSEEVLKEASIGLNTEENPYLLMHDGTGKVCYVMIVGNRGLCGTYNHSLLRFCAELLRKEERETMLITCGRWGKDIIKASGLKVQENYEVSDSPNREEALKLAEELKTLYRENKVDEIILVYQHYRSVLSQVPASERLLPLSNVTEESESRPIFEPEQKTIVDTLVNMYIGNTVYAALLEARTGEHSARMTAMTAAADNTDELINDLTLKLNHARQSAITTEISEIAGGAEALRNNTAGG